MLSINQKQSKIIPIVIICVICCAIAGAVYYFITNANNSNNDNTPVVTLNENDAQQKGDFVKTTTPTDNTKTNETATVESTNEAETDGTVIIDTSVADGMLVVKTKVKNIASGTCTLSLKKDATSVLNKQAPLLYQRSYSTCQGFAVNLKEDALSQGTYNLTLTVRDEKNKDHSVQETVTIGAY